MFKLYSCHYTNVPLGYSAVRHYPVEAAVTIKLKSGAYNGCSVVYAKTVPIKQVLDLIKDYRTMPKAPENWESCTTQYTVGDGELICIHDPSNENFYDTDVRETSNVN